MKIESNIGNGFGWAVNSENRGLVHAVTEEEKGHAIEFGLGWNINTGNVTISAATGLIYMKNTEDADFIVQALAVGFGSGTTSDIGELTLYRNPTTGTLIDNAVDCDMIQNRNFGSSAVFKSTTVAYKGASGATITNGDAIAQFYQGVNGRAYYGIDFSVPKGSSLALHVDPKLSSGSVKCYAAIIGYLKPFTEV